MDTDAADATDAPADAPPPAVEAVALELGELAWIGHAYDIYHASATFVLRDAGAGGTRAVRRRVVARLRDPWTTDDLTPRAPAAIALEERRICGEARAYKALAPAQGRHVPRFLGLWRGHYRSDAGETISVYIMLLDYVGEPIESCPRVRSLCYAGMYRWVLRAPAWARRRVR